VSKTWILISTECNYSIRRRQRLALWLSPLIALLVLAIIGTSIAVPLMLNKGAQG